MPKRKEQANEDYLVKRVKDTRGVIRKVKWLGHRGAPDRLVGWPHLQTHSFVELKEDDQPWGLQDHQAREHQVLRSCGIPVVVLNNKDQIDTFVKLMTGEK